MGVTGPPAVVTKLARGETGRRRSFNPFHSVKFFVLCHGLLQLSQLLVSGYMKSIVSTIEKRFGLSSQNSGMLSSLNEIGSTVLIVFISYFGSRVHRPRLIGCGGILVSFAAFTMSVPHFIMGRYVYDGAVQNNVTGTCHPAGGGPAVNESCGTGGHQSDHHVLSLLMLGQLLLGIGGVPIQPFGISYVDDYATHGGVVMRRLSIGLRGSAIMCCLAIFISICTAAPLLFLGCSTQRVVGVNTLNGTLDVRQSCNQGCSCGDHVYNPVCAPDDIEFISPCHAGCHNVDFNTQGKVMVYSNCSCVPGHGEVRPGTCGTSCSHLLPPFIFFLTLTGFVATFCQTPSFMLVLRSVKPEDKSLAIGIQFMLFRVLAWLPGPMLYGSTIDSTCILWENKCERKAACRYYNLNLFRARYIGLQMLFQSAAFLLFLMAYYFLRRNSLKLERRAGDLPPLPKERVELLDESSKTKVHLKV
ncbi:solute carrier organic anion transporter family member 2B1 [Amblyraja radiata]|uniref:solute carrier organic anion transporter family member 2B1 n=1 Tax=Amblyraja radiata TaxID=386614 RepID=UPI001403315E|nr:solute carrier organic anion transporter family member 2B1 [Amblyraja radiata]